MRTVLLFLPAFLLAGGTEIHAQDYRVRYYTIDDGLPSSHVRDITQDAQGRMWFATRLGIASYDGSDWSVYNLAHGLEWTDMFALRWDSEGVLWSASSASPSKISSFSSRKWSPYPPPEVFPPDARITAFALFDREGRQEIALGTDRGLLLSGKGYPEADRWRLVKGRITALADAGGRLVAGTSKGLAELEGDRLSTDIAAAVPADMSEVVGLTVEEVSAEGSGGTRLWIVARGGIGYLERGRFTRLGDAPPVIPAQGCVAAADRRGGLYLGSEDVLYHLRPQGGYERLGLANALASEGATSLYLDREDNLWVGSRRGLTKVPNRVFATFNLRHGLLEDEVTAVRERPDGTIVLAHPSGLSFLSGPRGTEVTTLDLTKRLPELTPRHDRIRDLAEDERGNLWIPTSGLVKLDPSGILSRFGEREGLRGAVHSVLAARGEVWAATGDGLFVLEGTRFVPVDAGAPHPTIRRIFASAGGIFLATSSGLYRSTGKGWHRWHCLPEEASCNSVFALYERPDGSLWVGTTAGLYRAPGANADGATLVRETAPEVDHPVYFILRDSYQRFWFGIDNGVLRWDGETLEHFTVQDGLAGRETNRAAGWVDSAGRVWIGTERGVTVYTEDPSRPARAPPIVAIESVETEGRHFPATEPRSLAFGATVTFHVRAVSLVDEDRVRVAYRLDGAEDDWSSPQVLPREELRYTNLAPGEYQLHVRALSSEGMESEVTSSAFFTVSRPFWQQPWFFLAVGLSLVTALYFLQSLAAQKRYSRRLEVLVEERVAELRKVEAELAKSQKLEAIGLLAGGIAHDFNNFLTVLMGNITLLGLPGRSEEERADDMKDAQAAILRASKLTQQLLTFSRGGAPVRKAASIAEVIEESASFILSGSKVRCRIELADDLRVVEIDAGQIHQLMDNLLINAMQAMPEGGTLRVVGRNVDEVPPGIENSSPEAAGPARFIAIDVVDDGVGIAREELTQVFDPYFTTKEEGRGMGLASAYSIARRHDGLLTVDSEPGKGSTFTLYLPASDAPLPEPEKVHDEPAAGWGRILVMDDEESVRRVIGAIAEELGYESAYASDGEEAMNLYRQSLVEGRRFDAVIMDLTVPGGMGGQETIRHLRELDPNVRAIVVSGYSNDPVMADHRAYGFVGRLAKPFRTPDLAQLLRQVVRPRETARPPGIES